ncbi:MAG: radical SAM protein, partial [Deltaproteobacteria bacterium]|nr:radical SAM protein [Deltaproteobacteria bacterium]
LTVIGGKDCSGGFGYELMSCVDFVDFVGNAECEVTIDRLVEHIRNPKTRPCNVLYRDDSGHVVTSPQKANLDLETLPFPEYDFQDFPLRHSDIILPLELGRGCPWGRCTFCPDVSYHVRCQSKTAKRVAMEVDYYLNISPDLKNFIILDSDALKDPQMIVDLAQHLEEKGLAFHFGEFRAERMEKRVLESLLRFGRWISQAFDDRLLRLMKKGVTALRNVEVLKMAAEIGIPLQFNLFTCYPKMTYRDLAENLRVMESIAHILISENIEIYPGEFYLPTDTAIFLDVGGYDLQKNTESIFSDVFEAFPMASYSNYPYPYTFDNHAEQVVMSERIRKKVDEIKTREPGENFMTYEIDRGALNVRVCRDGRSSTYTLVGLEKDVYLEALERSAKPDEVSEHLHIARKKVKAVLDDLEKKGLVLYSSDKKRFLSLAMKLPGTS